jgi:hypothetical protein
MIEEKCKTCHHWKERLTPLNFGNCNSLDFNAMVLVADKSLNAINEWCDDFNCWKLLNL